MHYPAWRGAPTRTEGYVRSERRKNFFTAAVSGPARRASASNSDRDGVRDTEGVAAAGLAAVTGAEGSCGVGRAAGCGGGCGVRTTASCSWARSARAAGSSGWASVMPASVSMLRSSVQLRRDLVVHSAPAASTWRHASD